MVPDASDNPFVFVLIGSKIAPERCISQHFAEAARHRLKNRDPFEFRDL